MAPHPPRPGRPGSAGVRAGAAQPLTAQAPSRPRRETGRRALPAGGGARCKRRPPVGPHRGAVRAGERALEPRALSETPYVPGLEPTPAQGAPVSPAVWERGHWQLSPDEDTHRWQNLKCVCC